MDIYSSYRSAVIQKKCTAALVWGKCLHHYSVLLCKRTPQQACVTADTPMDICSSYRCALTQRKCTAALVWGKCQSPLLSAALQKNLTSGLCHCRCTYGHLFFIQVCSDHKEKCTAALIRAKCKRDCSVLLCNRTSQQACVTADAPMDIFSSYKSAVIHKENALQHWSGQNAVTTV